jgi:hypothetical protein
VGGYAAAPLPQIFDAVTQRTVTNNPTLGTGLCPNGDVLDPTGACRVPVVGGNNPQCLASRSTAGTSSAPISNKAVPAFNPVAVTQGDGREYNQHLYFFNASTLAAVYQTNGFSTPMPMTGAYYRIHTRHTMAAVPDGGASILCTDTNMTDQIGCLVLASPCSLGYAGRGTLLANPNALPVKIKGMSPDLLCVQGHFLYPFARKLYLNTVVGFDSVNGQELQLLGCETDLAQPSLGTPAGLMTANVGPVAGFVPLPSFVNNAEPFCECFNQQALCTGAPAFNNACLNPPGNLDNFPGFVSCCGDGLLDSYEDCDNGSANGPLPAACSTTCRLNN